MTIYIYCKPILCKRLFTNKTMNMLLMRETPMWMNYSRSNLGTKLQRKPFWSTFLTQTTVEITGKFDIIL